jgi:NCAIR mutase (PurE)-related protein
MQEENIRKLLARVANGEISQDQALDELRLLPFEGVGFANIDHHRQLRQGMPEVIFCPGKTAAQIVEIAEKLSKHHELIIATRADEDLAEAVRQSSKVAQYHEEARILSWGKMPVLEPDFASVTIVTAGTSDLPVAREAEFVLNTCAVPNELIADVGVAGLHRVLHHLPSLQKTGVCIVVAGMDGVLASVVGGLLKSPVIACPTSVGYGSAFNGLAPLLTMLNSCASGVSVVNIDNGFGAAMAAFRIVQFGKARLKAAEFQDTERNRQAQTPMR